MSPLAHAFVERAKILITFRWVWPSILLLGIPEVMTGFDHRP
jgi:hypothetical protein